MTTRVYLQAGQLLSGLPEPNDYTAERVFINAGAAPELWVETESHELPDTGRHISFALAQDLDLGFGRIVGTVERKIRK